MNGFRGKKNDNKINGDTTATTSYDRVSVEEQQEYDYHAQGWGSVFREFRHSSCMMRPLTLVMILSVVVFFSMTLIFQVPGLLLGVLMAPILKRNLWYVEFLYPLPIGRWGHFLLMSFTSRMRHKITDKNQGFHSRTVEQKVEVVPNRVYIHFLPQWLDNIGYLIVCLPHPASRSSSLRMSSGRSEVDQTAIPPVALVIDCGECDAVLRAVELIQKYHYKDLPDIQLQSILSTHKHHDHTGGNKGLLKHKMGSHIDRVFGGAVERIPCCTDFLADGEKIQLPKFKSNDMNELIEIETIVVPAHTRGSVVYRLRSKVGEQAEYMFTGDTMFSGGAGVPFEADVTTEGDKGLSKANGQTHIRSNDGTIAMERCFTEIVSRAKPNDFSPNVCERILVFPGHEYTQELLMRQFQNMAHEDNKWKNFSPKDFFETVSHMYLAFHRRSLPHNSGKLMMIPSSLGREVHINTYMRSLRRSAELVVRALSFWHHHFCTTQSSSKNEKPSPNGNRISMDGSVSSHQLIPKKIPARYRKWNMDAKNVNDSVFTTVYTADLEALIEDLSTGKIKKKKALDQLKVITRKMESPVVNKRAIPGFLPSDKNIYRGICGLAILGSKPSALTVSDSRKMKMPSPMDYNSDKIRVSMKRLILLLTRLGFTETDEGEDISVIIKKLWTEANEYYRKPKESGKTYNSVDVEFGPFRDEVEIGILKWLMYGVSANQPSWFSKAFCMPCSPGTFKSAIEETEHPASAMTKKAGDLVSHDIIECFLCRNATGRVQFESRSSGASTKSDNSSIMRLSLKETESDQSGPVDMNPGTEITNQILQEATGIAGGACCDTFFPS